jgi:hypothetical protein
MYTHLALSSSVYTFCSLLGTCYHVFTVALGVVELDFVVPGKTIFTLLDGVGSLYVAGFVCVCFFAGFFVVVASTVFLAADLAAAIATCL